MSVGLRPINRLPADALPKTTSDVARGLRNLAEFGFTIHENFVSAEVADRLHVRLEEQAYMERLNGVGQCSNEYGLSDVSASEKSFPHGQARATSVDEPIYQKIPSLVNKGRVFVELFMNKTAHAYAEGMFGPHSWLLWGMNAIVTRKGSKEQFLHTDELELPQAMSTIPCLINCFICVTDFDADMGPTGLVPGTHRGNRPKFNGDEWTPRAPAVAKKGSAIIWDGRTWHGQCEHRSERTRYAIAMSYCLWAFRSGENYPASVHDRLYETLTKEELHMLGFRSTMVESMGIFGPTREDSRRTYVGGSEKYVPEMHRS
jgi:ectoine hydroxylase-related dioxygenase (phytanoyl-CoA dioxygenase family)